jgi:hypothetical protein
MNYWMAVGTKENWDTAFQHGNIWGLKEKQRHLWQALDENDRLLFYATRPVGGIIGYGIIRTKFKQNKPLWPDELKEHKVIWPLRLEFDVEFCLPPDKWTTKKIASKALFPRSGFQMLDQNMGKTLISAIGTGKYVIKEVEEPQIEEPITEYTGATEKIESAPLSHDQIKETLIQIGKLQNYIAEPEYAFDLGKIDVVWRRVANSVPTYAFEIQVGGNVYQALSKLKHAYDLWNSHIFIVAPESERDKVNTLLSGTFHEISSRIDFIELQQVEELYKRKKSYKDFEKELGI